MHSCSRRRVQVAEQRPRCDSTLNKLTDTQTFIDTHKLIAAQHLTATHHLTTQHNSSLRRGATLDRISLPNYSTPPDMQYTLAHQTYTHSLHDKSMVRQSIRTIQKVIIIKFDSWSSTLRLVEYYSTHPIICRVVLDRLSFYMSIIVSYALLV